MSTFRRALARFTPARRDRRWVYVPYDQLTDRIGPLSEAAPDELGIVMVESPAKAARRPYHRRKLALVLANGRRFALEQAERGVAVRHVVAPGALADTLAEVVRETGPLEVMRPAERELRVDLATLMASGSLVERPHAGWLTTRDDLGESPPWRMDAFYRQVRRRTGILMVKGKPEGGRFSFDGENRRPWRGEPPAPRGPTFPDDPVKREVCDLVATVYAHHPGALDPATLPTTLADARALWDHALQTCLPCFGPYEDAMARSEPGLFHTRVSELLHLHRLLPADVVRDVATADLPLPSREGFVRQVLGWREFVHHVHEATDGLRAVPRDVLGAKNPLPPAYWGAPSGLSCLDTVVDDVWREGWSHHITRLMVLSNLATLLDVDAGQLSDWFWVAYADAYDWVVEPNVLAMGTFSVGDVMTTKPYVSGAPYLHKMSDYCGGCRFDPKTTCPFTPLYWAFLGRHREALADNPRLKLPLAAEAKRSSAQREADAARFADTVARLGAGERVEPPA